MSEDKRFDVDATPNMDEIDRVQPAGDRPNKIPSLSNFQWDTKRMIVAGAVGGAALFTVLTVAAGLGGSDEVPVAPTKPAAVEVPYDPKSVIAPTLATAPIDPNAPVPLSGEQVPAIGPGGAPAQGVSHAQTDRRREQALALQEAARRSTLVAYAGQNNAMGAARPAMRDENGASEAGQRQPGATRLDELRRTSTIGTATARMIGDRNYLITAGAIIPCTLQTAMDSSVPGYATCIIPRDIYSDNGRVVLLEKGTRVFGEYQGGLNRGQYRLFAMWTRAVTPRGVAIDIGSPASDQLGRSGMTGTINRFFWERFGTALLFSVLESGGEVAASAVGPDGNNITRVPSDSTSQILSDTQQIRPVVRINQGAEMGITVAQDFDFSSVYGLGLK